MRNFLAGLTAFALACGIATTGAAQERGYGFIAESAPAVSVQARKGLALLEVPVRHRLTGRLDEAISSKGLMKGPPPLPAGQPMFGVLMGKDAGFRRPPEVQIVWCTLRFSPLPKTRPDRWASVCLPRAGKVHLWIDSPILTPRSVSLEGAATSAAPKITVGPAAFDPPLKLSYRFLEFDDDDVDIDIYLKIDRFEEYIGQTNPKRQADGSVLLEIMGGQVRLTPVPGDRKAVAIEVLKPLQTGSDQLPLS